MGDPPPEPPELSGTGLTLSALSNVREELATILSVREPVGPISVSTFSTLMLGFWREGKRERERERERERVIMIQDLAVLYT